MKVLITGGFGYLGGRIASHLGRVFPIEDICLLARANGQKTPSWAEGFDIIRGDVLDDASLLEACESVNLIVHLAALNEIESGRDPKKALEVNGEGTLRLLDAASEKGVSRFIYFSTFHVYGLNAKGRITEETIPAPFHPYAISHHVAEDFVRMYAKNGKVKGLILRLSNGFGYPSHIEVNRWTLAFNDFCLQAALKNEIILKTSGKQHRDFITLTDVSRCVNHLIENEKIFDSPDRIYNLGGGASISIANAAQIVAARCEKVLGRKPAIIIESSSDAQSAEPVDYSIDKLKSTSYTLLSNVEDEIDKTLLFCEANREALRCRLP
jgi:UDP-glucose 4-epimerase